MGESCGRLLIRKGGFTVRQRIPRTFISRVVLGCPNTFFAINLRSLYSFVACYLTGVSNGS